MKKDKLPLSAMQRQGVLDRLLGSNKKCVKPDCPGCLAHQHDVDSVFGVAGGQDNHSVPSKNAACMVTAN